MAYLSHHALGLGGATGPFLSGAGIVLLRAGTATAFTPEAAQALAPVCVLPDSSAALWLARSLPELATTPSASLADLFGVAPACAAFAVSLPYAA